MDKDDIRPALLELLDEELRRLHRPPMRLPTLRERIAALNRGEKIPALVPSEPQAATLQPGPTVPLPVPRPVAPAACAEHVRIGGPTLAAAIETYTRERSARNAWAPRTAKAVARALQDLLQHVGDVPVSTLSHDHGESCAAALRDAGKAQETRRNILNKLSSFGKWAVKRGLLQRNVLSGLLDERREVRPDQQRRVLTPDEITKVLTLPPGKKPWHQWVPLLLLHTGARVNEIAQLRTGDVRDDDGTPFLRLSAEAGRLKNLASERSIPIHPALIKRGFLRLVEDRRAAGHERLWDLPCQQDGQGATVSRWWSDTRKKLGIGVGLHNFRHTFATALADAGAQEQEIKTLLGHIRMSGETARYVKPPRPASLLRVVQLLDFGTGIR